MSSLQIRALLEAAANAGVEAGKLVRAGGIDEARLGAPFAWFSLAELDHAMVAAAALSKDPAFGLHWGESAPMVQFGQITVLAATAPTLRTVIECATRYQTLLATRAEYAFAIDGTRGIMSYDPLATSEQGLRIRTELLLAATCRMLKYFGAASALHCVRVPYARPAHRDLYDEVFGVPVEYDRCSAQLVFAADVLDRVQLTHNLELHKDFLAQAEKLRLRAASEQTLSEQTAATIRSALPNVLQAHEVASSMNLSERSFRRLLAEEGTTYSELLEQVRKQVVTGLLESRIPSTKEMAAATGYADVSAFHRAFRRWTGSTPAQSRLPRARPK